MKLVLWILVLFIPAYAFSQVAGTPEPTPGLTPVLIPLPSDNPGLISSITGLISLARGFTSLGFYVALGTTLKYLVDLSQLSFLGSPLLKLPVKYQLLVRSGIAAVIAVLGFAAAGAPIITAIVAGLGTGAGSGFIHELLEDLTPSPVATATSALPTGPVPPASA